MEANRSEWNVEPGPEGSDPLMRTLTGVARQQFSRLLPPLGPRAALVMGPRGAMNDPDGDMALLRSDPLLAGQTLAAANILEPLAPAVTVLEDAAERLGAGACGALLQASMASARPLPKPFEEPAERLAAHCVTVAGLTRRLARASGLEPETAYAAGLLHDVGRALVLHSLARMVRLPEIAAVLEVDGVEAFLDHPIADRLGRELVRCWALPRELRDAVGVRGVERPRRGIAALVWRAESMVAGGINQHRLGSEANPVVAESALGGLMAALSPRVAVA